MTPLQQPTATAQIFDACWRAVAYCLHPRVIFLSFMPLLLSLGTMALMAWFFWADAVTALSQLLVQWSWSSWVLEGLSAWSLPHAPQWVAGFILLLVMVPVVVVACLLLVAVCMTPALIKLVVDRRFRQLEVRYQTPWWSSLAWSMGASVLAVVALLVTLPLWLVPPFGLILPPLIWGWLTYRVMAFDALSAHATPEERKTLLKTYRMPLLTMGVICGFLGAAPTMIWALSALALVFAPFVVAFSLWVYTLVFAFASLWFAHFLLPALHALRAQSNSHEVLLATTDASVFDPPATFEKP